MTIREKLSDQLICPISHEIMQNPVIATPCGHSFDEAHITQWINRSPRHECPLDRQTIVELVPNHSLRQVIDQIHQQPAEEKKNEPNWQEMQSILSACLSLHRMSSAAHLAQIKAIVQISKDHNETVRKVAEEGRKSTQAMAKSFQAMANSLYK